jgi:hypothetical protein
MNHEVHSLARVVAVFRVTSDQGFNTLTLIKLNRAGGNPRLKLHNDELFWVLVWPMMRLGKFLDHCVMSNATKYNQRNYEL